MVGIPDVAVTRKKGKRPRHAEAPLVAGALRPSVAALPRFRCAARESLEIAGPARPGNLCGSRAARRALGAPGHVCNGYAGGALGHVCLTGAAAVPRMSCSPGGGSGGVSTEPGECRPEFGARVETPGRQIEAPDRRIGPRLTGRLGAAAARVPGGTRGIDPEIAAGRDARLEAARPAWRAAAGAP